MTTDADAETAVKALIDRWAAASRRGDLEAIMACYAPDVRAFDAIIALEFPEAASYRDHWETCLSYMTGEMIFEVQRLKIETGGDIAFAHYLARCGGADETGAEHVSWLRATVCCRKHDGEWRIAHEHFSDPFDPETGQALTDLKP